uniref:Uncharacterized protein n=1 Tax=Tanacetum cinerariifolium TaxID=118510 RepID=A0A6L2K298_TANCI|nr:hypothetical protein [Tanacetum cinerariifolium]
MVSIQIVAEAKIWHHYLMWLRYEGQEYTDAVILDYKARGPLVLELMLEFFSTCMISDNVLELDVTDTLCFQLVPSYTSIWDPLRRLCHRLIVFNIFERGYEPEKVAVAGAAQADQDIPKEGV